MRLWHIHERHASLSSEASDDDCFKIPSHPAVEPKISTTTAVRFSDKQGKRLDSVNSSVSVQSVRALSDQPTPPIRTETYLSAKNEAIMPFCKYELAEARSPPQVTIFDYFSCLKYLRFAWRVVTGSSHPPENNPKTRRRRIYTEIVTVHVPIEICLVLSKLVSHLFTFLVIG
jgi:hypothetical protein